MSDKQSISALIRAVEILGSQAAAAAAIGTKQQYISDKIRAGRRVPAEWAIPLDLATSAAGDRVSCHELRPDLWPASFRPTRTMRAA